MINGCYAYTFIFTENGKKRLFFLARCLMADGHNPCFYPRLSVGVISEGYLIRLITKRTLTMADWLLRMEGVNLNAVLSDTDNISVRRGGSLLLRQAVLDITRKFTLTPISTGASIGLFQTSGSADEIDSLASNVCDYLKTGNYRHFTFVVNSHPLDDDFITSKEGVLAKNRWQQLQTVSLALPTGAAPTCCEMDHLRPADAEQGIGQGDQQRSVSASVYSRHHYGRKQRQGFYQEEVGTAYSVTDNLHDLSQNGGYGNLDNKMAVIYLDGNGFGALQQQCCRDAATQKEFDKTIQKQRRQFLQQILKKATHKKDFKTSSDEIRLETLLWGGDEMMLVVPAWKGMAVLQDFFHVSKNWQFQGQAITHAGGLVFCSHKTPITRIRQLAEELANGVKEKSRNKNAYDYLVLESVDYPTTALDTYWQQVYQSSLAKDRQPLTPIDDWSGSACQALREQVLDKISVGQLHTLAGSFLSRDEKESTQRKQRMTEVIDNFSAIETTLKDYFPNQTDAWQWVHLLELLDYLDPQKPEGRS
jgi:hypothetical protein